MVVVYLGDDHQPAVAGCSVVDQFLVGTQLHDKNEKKKQTKNEEIKYQNIVLCKLV